MTQHVPNLQGLLYYLHANCSHLMMVWFRLSPVPDCDKQVATRVAIFAFFHSLHNFVMRKVLKAKVQLDEREQSEPSQKRLASSQNGNETRARLLCRCYVTPLSLLSSRGEHLLQGRKHRNYVFSFNKDNHESVCLLSSFNALLI